MDNIMLILLVIIAVLLIYLVLFGKNNQELEKQIIQLQSLLNVSQQNTIQQQNENNKLLREEITNNFKMQSDTALKQLDAQNMQQNQHLQKLSVQMDSLIEKNFQQQEKLNESVAKNLAQLQLSNEQKLDAMRQVVDEKLNTTLSRRLDDAFKNVSDQLQLLYKSLGEMQTLSTGIHSLNRVLTNVKLRGTWGEVQLGALLEQIMSKEQYEQSVMVKRGNKERVDFAIKLPGKECSDCVWLPIDAKFTQEDYLRLCEASEKADASLVNEAIKAIETKVKQDARSIRDKYISPPTTTDFAVMFLPTEGLYAEVLRINGLCEYCQNECRIIIAGPTTLAALLNSLRLGFATLAIEKKSSEVWRLLGAIKKQYSIFDAIIDKSLDKIEDVKKEMTKAQDKSKQIYSKLNKVEELDELSANKMLEE